MRLIFSNPEKRLFALTGFDAHEMLSPLTQPGNFIKLELDWITLHFGRDAQWNEFVVAVIDGDSFVFGSVNIPDPCYCPPYGSRSWVCAAAYFPHELLAGETPAGTLSYAGFTVTHATDGIRKDFVSVAVPGGKHVLVFRNMKSSATWAWRPRRGGSTNQVPVVTSRQFIPVRPVCVSAQEGDAESDEFLSALGVAV